MADFLSLQVLYFGSNDPTPYEGIGLRYSLCNAKKSPTTTLYDDQNNPNKLRDGDGEVIEWKEAGTDYERNRKHKIRQNKAELKSLGLDPMSSAPPKVLLLLFA